MVETESLSTEDKTRVEVLLKEYETLRNEIMGRINNRFAVIGFIVALIAFIGSQSEIPLHVRCVIGGLAFVVILVVYFRLGQLIKRCAVRIGDIEEKINSIMGEKLLVWESRIAKSGLFHWFYRKPPAM